MIVALCILACGFSLGAAIAIPMWVCGRVFPSQPRVEIEKIKAITRRNELIHEQKLLGIYTPLESKDKEIKGYLEGK